MGNGLIFPYPLVCAHIEPPDANHPNRPCDLRVVGVCGEAGTRRGSR